MNESTTLKIRDSVDLFLCDNKSLLAYFLNSRLRKFFKLGESMVFLLESIDGIRTVEELVELLKVRYGVVPEQTTETLNMLLRAHIVTEVVREQSLLSEEQVERYSRQINYFSEFLDSELEGIAAQRKLRDSHVLIFGAGAVGGDIAIQLAMAGVGRISLFDIDEVAPSDVARHIYFRESDIGSKKVEALKNVILDINSDVDVETYARVMRPETEIETMIQDADFVVNTLDEPYIGYTSAKISRVCVKHNTPHYIAGGFDAHLASTGELIIPHLTPCVECYAGYFKKALKDWNPKPHPVMERHKEAGGLSCLSLFSSSFACIEIIKCLTGLTDIKESFKTRGEFLFDDMSLYFFDVRKDPDCPVCGE